MPGKSKRGEENAKGVSAHARVAGTRPCWCGSTDLAPFGPEYGACRTCGTLVYLKDTPPEELLARDDESGFYGKNYWLERQEAVFGFPDIHGRARSDLPERNLHWLKALLKYQLPPAKVIDVGCAHGSFVALMRQAGYQAEGLELSPWVVAFGEKTFGIPVHAGPIESLDAPAASLDVIVLMDVLEHLPDPVATMRRCLELLKPAGLLLVQTPCFKEGASYAEMVESKDLFLGMLIPDEHIYLFSRSSVTEFFRRLGAGHVAFEPAIFAQHDMFIAVSRAPLRARATGEIESALMAAPGRRMALALLDLRETARQQVESLTRALEQGRTEIAQLREFQSSATQQIHTLTGWVEQARADAAAARESLHSQAGAHASEVATFKDVHDSAVKQMETLTGWVHEARADATAAKESIISQATAHASEVAAFKDMHASAVKQIATLTGLLQEARESATALQKMVEEQRKAHDAQVADARASNAVLRDRIAELDRQHASAVKQIETLTGWVHEARDGNVTLQAAMEEQRKAHAAQAAELGNLNMSALKQIETLTGWVHEARDANATMQRAMEEQKEAQAREVAALQGLLARPLLKLALGLSNIPSRLTGRSRGKSGG